MTNTDSTFTAMTTDDRWLGFGYLGERMHAHAADVALADDFALSVAADWTAEELFAWANSKDGRWFGDVMFGASDHTDAVLDMAARYVRKQA